MVTGSSIRRHVWIKGRVQGVNFRNAAKQVADQLHVGGWVKNLEDGRVEAVFEGPRDALERILTWCRHGPPAARVTEIDLQSEPASGEFLRFTVVR
ncbi:MAG TPA: acylphosphatase [Candidatus Thermoplasmatota archaeon]|nr:acylphosphatase [Candidatus Thermoplasmatota archaeon]